MTLSTVSPAKRVLVVEDNKDAAGATAAIIAGLGHEVRAAYDGASALSLFRQFRPEFVLLDITLPDMEGYDVARAIRREQDGRAARIIALTGRALADDRERSLEAGCDQHLVKPLEPQFLESLLGLAKADPAPAGGNDVRMRTLQRAAAITRGTINLAQHLNVDHPRLMLWMQGKATIPAHVFSKAVELVLADDLASVSGAARGQSPDRLPRVLVVDDDAGGAYGLARLIRQLGYPVETAMSGMAAVSVARRMRPDVVFLDLRLPDLDGVQIAEALRLDGLQPRIIAATAYGSDEDRERTAQAGFEAHLVKPIDENALEPLLPRVRLDS